MLSSQRTSSLLLCFCRLADMVVVVVVVDISLGALVMVESNLGRGMLEGLSVKGSWPRRLVGVPRNVPPTPDMLQAKDQWMTRLVCVKGAVTTQGAQGESGWPIEVLIGLQEEPMCPRSED